MTRVNYRLLAIDIDGTLINRYGEVSGENREALDTARGSGRQVCLSTGRSMRSTLKIIDELALDSCHIFFAHVHWRARRSTKWAAACNRRTSLAQRPRGSFGAGLSSCQCAGLYA